MLAALEAGDAGYLARWIGQASGHRRRALAAQFDQRPEELYRVQVHVPDRPGVFAGITQALGAARINIEDFELHHFTPERGGTVELLVAGREAAERAVELLDAQGYGALAAPGAGGRDVSAATGADRLEVAPAAALVGELAVPGRQVDLAPRAAARRGLPTARPRSAASAPTPTRSRRWPRSSRWARASSGSTRPTTRLRVHGCGLRGLQAPDGADRRPQRRHAPAPAARACSSARAARSRSTATSRSAAARSTAWRCRCG